MRASGSSVPQDPGEAELQRKYQRIRDLAAQGDRDALRSTLRDPAVARAAVGALLTTEGDRADTATTRAILDQVVRNPSLSAADRAQSLQDLLLGKRVDADEWCRFAIRQRDEDFARMGLNFALRNLPPSQSVPLVLPLIDGLDAGLKPLAFELLTDVTGMYELPPDSRAWESWWRSKGKELFR